MKNENSLPHHAFVPGGPWPRPAERIGTLAPIADDWRDSEAYLRGIALFNAGYYWEAHEVWEGLWHAHARAGPVADVLKGLIKLAAAGVKVRQQQPHGIVTHATRAGALFRGLIDAGHGWLLGLDLRKLAEWAEGVVSNPPSGPAPAGAAVAVVFEFGLRPG